MLRTRRFTVVPSRQRSSGAGIDPLTATAGRVRPVKLARTSPMARSKSVPASTCGWPADCNAHGVRGHAPNPARTPPAARPWTKRRRDGCSSPRRGSPGWNGMGKLRLETQRQALPHAHPPPARAWMRRKPDALRPRLLRRWAAGSGSRIPLLQRACRGPARAARRLGRLPRGSRMAPASVAHGGSGQRSRRRRCRCRWHRRRGSTPDHPLARARRRGRCPRRRARRVPCPRSRRPRGRWRHLARPPRRSVNPALRRGQPSPVPCYPSRGQGSAAGGGVRRPSGDCRAARRWRVFTGRETRRSAAEATPPRG